MESKNSQEQSQEDAQTQPKSKNPTFTSDFKRYLKSDKGVEDFEALIMNFPKAVSLSEPAVQAAIAYERNAAAYDLPGPRPTPIPRGQRMSDFAAMYGTTVTEMKKHWQIVEVELDRERAVFEAHRNGEPVNW